MTLQNVPDEPLRLSKVVASLVPCSRREAEQYIAEGWVRVDGRIVEEPQARVSHEVVEIDPRARLQAPLPATFLMHKPAGMGTDEARAALGTATHWDGDTSGIRWVRSHATGLVPLLELPAQAEGLAVFSQDARIVRRLRDHANPLEEELIAQVEGTVAAGGLSRLSAGLVFQGRRLPPARFSWQSEHRMRIAAKAVPLDMLPWMCEQVGLRLTALRRIRIGRIPMAGLPAGQWRYLRPQERF